MLYKEFKNDPKYMIEVIKNNPYTIEHLGEDLKNDAEFMLGLWRVYQYSVQSYVEKMPKLQKETTSFELEMLFFKSINKNLRSNKDFMIKACKKREFIYLNIMDDSLKNDKVFILDLIHSCMGTRLFMSLAYASKSLLEDREVVIEGLKQSCYNLVYIRNDLAFDDEVVSVVLKEISKNNLDYIGLYRMLDFSKVDSRIVDGLMKIYKPNVKIKLHTMNKASKD